MTIQRKDQEVGSVTLTTIEMDHAPANVLDLEHVRELASVIHQIRADDRTRLLVLRGAGSVFSTGVDIREHTPEVMPTLLPAFHQLFESLLGLPAITIAALHGRCLGGAAELAFACDRVVAEKSTEIGLPEIQLGCFPPVAIPQLVSRVGSGRATELILGGENIPVTTLKEWGLVDVVVEANELDKGVETEITRYSKWSPAVLGQVAHLLHEEIRHHWARRIPAVEHDYLENLLPHPDCSEGIAAFVEKRDPKWQEPAGLMSRDDIAL